MTDAVLATTMSTHVGTLALLVQHDMLVAAGFTDMQDQYARLHTDSPLTVVNDLGRFSAAMSSYLDGDVEAMNDLPVSQPGGAFRQAAWKVMREVPSGEVISYAELAARAGSPGAVRAAGSACAQNMVHAKSICLNYGLAVKEWLLAHERGDSAATVSASSSAR